MADNKKLKGKPDRSKVAGGENYEVSYLAKRHDVSTQQVTGAIRAVGNLRTDVEAYIKSKKNGKNK